jgi:mRNA interferase HicA
MPIGRSFSILLVSWNATECNFAPPRPFASVLNGQPLPKGTLAVSNFTTVMLNSTYLCIRLAAMKAQELKRLLASKGCTFETHKGGSGHITVRRGNRTTQLPMHGSHKELGTGLVRKVLKDLGLK